MYVIMHFIFCKLFLVVIFLLSANADDQMPCQGCIDLVDGLLKGLDKTVGKNFGGGDVNWEEKKNLKYKTSELRLIEILENACTKDNFQCHKLLEEYEEAIEKWYKKQQRDEPISLHEFLCIDSAKVCCPDNTFGENCEECPKGGSDEICFGRGSCEGAGDKQGSGKCVCDTGYGGEFCSDCADRHFKSFSNETYTLCTLCHETCQTCKGGNATDCESCRPGYREEHENKEESVMKCVDVNECVEQRDLCPVGQYCVNTEGSYKCEDIDECASGAICLGMYEVCVNTPGHYKCECARFFRRDPTSGQCQPDPAIYSRYVPERPKKTEEKKEEGKSYCVEEDCHNQSDHDRYVEALEKRKSSGSKQISDDDDQLSVEDWKRLIVGVIICMIGTAAAKGDIFWNLMFFLSLILTGLWWASDKTDQIAKSIVQSYKRKQEM